MARALHRGATLGPGAYLLVFLAPLGLALGGMSLGISPAVASLGATGFAAAVLMVLERLRPAQVAWRRWGPDVRVDATYLTLGSALVAALQYGGVRLGVLVLAGREGPWPTGLPVVLQIALALLVIELGQYAAHRALHGVAWLWPFHAVHHSPRRLYWLNAFRAHPCDVLLTVALPVMPLVLLGASEEVLLGASVVTGVHAMQQHTNVRFREGVLTYVLSSTTLHQWHHGCERDLIEGNYGSTLIIWDLLFATRRLPRERGPQRVGLSEGEQLPERYGTQLVYPFRSGRRHAVPTAHRARSEPATPGAPP